MLEPKSSWFVATQLGTITRDTRDLASASFSNMRFPGTKYAVLTALTMLPSVVRGTALTATLEANEISCYYADVDGTSDFDS